MKPFLFRSMIGLFFGGFLAVVVTGLVIYTGDLETLDSKIFMKNAVGFLFCGWFFVVTPMYFENENWSLLRQTVYHMLTVLVLYYVTAFGVGWFSFTVKGFLVFFGLFIVLYATSWFGFYSYYRHEAKKLNEELKGW